MAIGKVCLYHKGEKFIICFHLQNRSIVIPKMIVGSLPQICVRHRCYLNAFFCDFIILRLPEPFHFFNHHYHPCILYSPSLRILWNGSASPQGRIFIREKKRIRRRERAGRGGRTEEGKHLRSIIVSSGQ